jgi:hypothetical protein
MYGLNFHGSPENPKRWKKETKNADIALLVSLEDI